MKVDQTQQLAVKAHWPDGHSRDVTWLCQFFSNDETTVSVTPEGLVKPLRNGEAAVRVHFQGLVQVAEFTMPFDVPVDPAQYAKKNNYIDDHVFAKLAALHIPVSPDCDDATFIRRAFLDTIGELPTAQEVSAFLADPATDKRARLIDHLLAAPEWADYWAMNLCDILQNRKERDHDVRGPKNVRAFHAWVRQQLIANRPWNQIAMLFAGAGVTAGKIIGASDKTGAHVTDRPVRPADVAHTVYTALGINPRKQIKTPEGRPLEILNEGATVEELFT
jgi:hypothetical protein